MCYVRKKAPGRILLEIVDPDRKKGPFMIRVSLFSVIIIALFITSCALDVDTSALADDLNSVELFTLVRTWYTHPEDDRYFFTFREDGTLLHRYYQDFGFSGGSLNSFVTIIGRWRYLDDERSRFSVGWDDSIDRHYLIVENNETGLIVQRAAAGPAGRGLGSTTTLLRSANPQPMTSRKR